MTGVLAEKQNLMRVLDNLREGIIAHDLNRRIFFFNREAERITGYSRDEVLYRDCHEAFGEPFCGQHCLFDDGRENDIDNFPENIEYPVNIITKDGLNRKAEISVSPIRDDSGHMVGVLASINDLTELLELRFKTAELKGFSNIIGRDSKMLQIFQQIRDLSGYDYPVNISGETGTGKELVAEAIHNESRRAGAPFVPINCGALPEGLIESELFGHVKGAFSGAIRDKRGRFELAHTGTVFLDEIAELSNSMQVKLLRFLQTGKFEKVGAEKTTSVDVRIISATNKDLKNEIKEGRFREDLYYRLNVIPIYLPPLRERRNDIPLLIEHFLDQHSREHGHNNQMSVSNEALTLMMDYDWPGNVRQLQNVLQFAIVRSGGQAIRSLDLPAEFRTANPGERRRGPYKKLDVETVRAALQKTGGNKARAAKILEVGRATLYRFIREFPEAVPER
ncbi:MAG: sigma 54-interacting transcriptional regulator [Desulfobacteraceae bacterium]|nr:sigma 54-interacting transcriptional regulator [Desulfobacteraceae bacterium]